ncbi:putative endo-1,4-beta-xylanase A [Penicillium rolfsii]|nr:putative endo-1,4-beta-xylanase A [Penicillium rolfsii]
MPMLCSILLLSTALVGSYAAPAEDYSPAKKSVVERSVSPGSGDSGGYYYTYWTAGQGTIDYENYDVGGYSINWSDVADFTAGKGWMPGSDRTINYSGSFTPTAANALLSVYGWTVNPLIEYYITDSYAIDPSTDASAGFNYMGSVDSDGGTYNIYTAPRENAGSILGTANFTQYWSIRTSPRVGGTITTSNHFSAWSSHGMNLGSFDASSWCYQILSTEGLWESSGSSSITVW